MSELNIIGKCRDCGNEDEKTLKQLGGTVKDNFAEIDVKCDKCGNIIRSHYDCTSFRNISQADLQSNEKVDEPVIETKSNQENKSPTK